MGRRGRKAARGRKGKRKRGGGGCNWNRATNCLKAGPASE